MDQKHQQRCVNPWAHEEKLQNTSLAGPVCIQAGTGVSGNLGSGCRPPVSGRASTCQRQSPSPGQRPLGCRDLASCPSSLATPTVSGNNDLRGLRKEEKELNHHTDSHVQPQPKAAGSGSPAGGQALAWLAPACPCVNNGKANQLFTEDWAFRGVGTNRRSPTRARPALCGAEAYTAGGTLFKKRDTKL